jgi:TPR repeat protein
MRLGALYYDGKGVKQDYTTAANLYQKACDAEDASGCLLTGILYEGGIGVRQNIQKALELYGKGCDMRDQKVCDSYAKLKRTIDVK